jgi:hypothetical protein
MRASSGVLEEDAMRTDPSDERGESMGGYVKDDTGKPVTS